MMIQKQICLRLVSIILPKNYLIYKCVYFLWVFFSSFFKQNINYVKTIKQKKNLHKLDQSGTFS